MSVYDTFAKLIKLGSKLNEGYVIADGYNHDLLISCEINRNIVFEEAFLSKYPIKCIAFVGAITPRITPALQLLYSQNANLNIVWIPKHVSYENTCITTNLKDYLHKDNIFLKMDIAGSEYDWIYSMTKADMEKFSQIVIKFHWPFDSYRMNALKKINETHYIIHISCDDGRIYKIYNQSLGNIGIPEIFNVTYINKKFFDKPLNKISKHYPIRGLDYIIDETDCANKNRQYIEFSIPNSAAQIFVGSSNHQTMSIKLDEGVLPGHNLINKLHPSWQDKFDISIMNRNLIIKRTDINEGWGQEMILPKKRAEVLIYQGFPFHYEMIGCALEYCKTHGIIAHIVMPIINEPWLEFYRKYYTFTLLSKLPEDINYYLFVFLLTDDDMSFPEAKISQNVVCIDHYKLVNRRPKIEYHISIAPFHNDNYVFPVYNIVDYETKLSIISTIKRPIISIIGNSSLISSFDDLRFITNINDFDIYIINRALPVFEKRDNVFLFENIPATQLMDDILLKSTYVLFIPNNTVNAQRQRNCEAISASFPISFTTGCKLILPREINKKWQLNSCVEWLYDDYNISIVLDLKPSLIDVFEERIKLLNIADRTLNALPHMRLFFESKVSNKIE